MQSYLSHGFLQAALALLVESLIGYPKLLYELIGHPVEWFGRLISYLDNMLNDPGAPPCDARRTGIAAVAAMIGAAGIVALTVHCALTFIPGGSSIEALVATTLIAQSSLRQHVTKVANALDSSLSEARTEVAKIVGRDPTGLDESGISKAALESLAENSSDGIIAPALWFALAGLPGIAIYKMINTADSMIGHKSDRYLHFGRAAAKLDDLVNYPASRMTGLLFAAAARLSSRQLSQDAWNTMLRDAKKHRSPNAGWPEAAMAGALGLRFGGPRNYDGEFVDLPWMGNGREEITRSDITRGLRLYEAALVLFAALFFALAIVL